MKIKMKSSVLVIIVVVILLFLASGSFYTVVENEYGVVKRFSKVVNIKSEPGLYVKVPFIEEISYLPKVRKLYDMVPSDVLTADKKAMIVDNFVIWKITEPLTFLQTVGTTNEMEGRIDTAVYNSIKNTVGTMEQTALISQDTSGRGDLNSQVTTQVDAQLKGYGVNVIGVEIKRYDLPTDNADAVYRRMVSEREQMAESYRADGEYEAAIIRNETDKQVTIILSEANAKAEALRGEGESEYMRILSEAYSGSQREEFYSFVRTLDALAKSMTGEKTVIIPSSSAIAKALLGG